MTHSLCISSLIKTSHFLGNFQINQFFSCYQIRKEWLWMYYVCTYWKILSLGNFDEISIRGSNLLHKMIIYVYLSLLYPFKDNSQHIAKILKIIIKLGTLGNRKIKNCAMFDDKVNLFLSSNSRKKILEFLWLLQSKSED